MRRLSNQKRGISLLIVIGGIAVAFILLGSLLLSLQESVLQGKQEGVIVQSRCLAEAGVSRALAGYPQEESATAEEFGHGFYWYRISQLDEKHIRIVSTGARHREHRRLPAVRLTTHWRLVPKGDEHSFQLLSWSEQIVPSSTLRSP